MDKDIIMKSIGTIRTPYIDKAPRQPDPEDKGEFCITLYDEYKEGLKDLESFNYIYLIFYLDRMKETPNMYAKPPMAGGRIVGLFASRSPVRPNPIGLSIVRIKKVEGNIIYISPVDALDQTPVLDIKPYIKNLDIKADSNDGWISEK